MEKNEYAGGPFVRLFGESKSLSRNAFEILSASWRMGTGKRYNFLVERFVKFCRERYTDPIQATTEMGIEFLTEYFKIGVGYSSVNSERSALSSIIKPVCNITFGKSPLVCRLLKEVFNMRPALPKYVKLGMLPKLLLLSSQNQLLQTVIWKYFLIDEQYFCA